MTIQMLAGAELGVLAAQEYISTGTVSISSTQKRTGAYAYRVNPTAGVGTINLGKINSTGRWAVLNGSHWVTFWMYVATLPGGTVDIAYLAASTNGTSPCAKLTLGSGGDLKIVGSGLPATAATLSTATWYKIEFRAANSGTCGLAVNDGSEATVTGNAQTPNYFTMGTATASSTFDVYFDDIVIDDASFLSVDAKVELMAPDANGNYTGWTASAGNKWDCVEEVPVDTAQYVSSGTGAGTIRYSCALESASNAGISGTIHAVRAECYMWEVTSTSTLGGMGMRCGGTDAECGDADIGTTTAVLVHWLRTTNPADSAAFEPSDLDGLEIIARRASGDTSNIRCGGMYAEVLFTPAVDATIVGVTATAPAAALLATIEAFAPQSATVVGVTAAAPAAGLPAAVLVARTVPGEAATAPAAGLLATIAATRIATIVGVTATAPAAALLATIATVRIAAITGLTAAADAAGLHAAIEAAAGDNVIGGETATASAATNLPTIVAVRPVEVIGALAESVAAGLLATVATVRIAAIAGITAVATAAAGAGAPVLSFPIPFRLAAGVARLSVTLKAGTSRSRRAGQGEH